MPPLSVAVAVPVPVSFLIFASILKFKFFIFINDPAGDDDADDSASAVY